MFKARCSQLFEYFGLNAFIPLFMTSQRVAHDAANKAR